MKKMKQGFLAVAVGFAAISLSAQSPPRPTGRRPITPAAPSIHR